MSLPKTDRAAIIDIGSNSVRLVIYDVLGTSVLPTFNEKVMAGLGRGLMQTGRLSPEGREASLQALSRYCAILKALGLRNFTAVATAAARTAEDGAAFIKQASRVLGRPIRVLSGEDEARLSAVGVETSLHKPLGVIGDLGGSSLEFMQIGNGNGKGEGESHLLGPLSLRKNSDDLKALRREIRAVLETSAALAQAEGCFYAVGGVWRTFAKLQMQLDDYPLRVLQGYQMSSSQVGHAAKVCIDSLTNSATRSLLETVDKRRAVNLPVAAILLQEILAVSKLEHVVISSSGVREGVLREIAGIAGVDPLLDGAIAFARLERTQIAFGKALYDFIMPALTPDKDLFGSPAADARIERATCMLADSAGRHHPDHRARAAYDQALRGPYVALSHAERAFVAYAVGRRYAKDFSPPDEYAGLINGAKETRARQVGSAMRLGAVFSGRSAPILKRAKLLRKGDQLVLRVRKSDRAMVSATVKRRLNQTANQLRLKAEIEIV